MPLQKRFGEASDLGDEDEHSAAKSERGHEGEEHRGPAWLLAAGRLDSFDEALEFAGPREQAGVGVEFGTLNGRQLEGQPSHVVARNDLPHKILEHDRDRRLALIIAVTELDDFRETAAKLPHPANLFVCFWHVDLSPPVHYRTPLAALASCLD